MCACGGVMVRPFADCGKCQLCCKLPAIHDEGGLEKPAGVWCPHRDIAVGCTTYSTRPRTCREFFCLWKMLRDRPGGLFLPSDRPDRLRCLYWIADAKKELNLPADHPHVPAIACAVNSPGAWQRLRNRRIIATIRRSGLPVIISTETGDILYALAEIGDKSIEGRQFGEAFDQAAFDVMNVLHIDESKDRTDPETYRRFLERRQSLLDRPAVVS